MPNVEFSSQLAQHVGCPSEQVVDATRWGQALTRLLDQHPKLRDYMLDENGDVRSHIAVFIDGEMIAPNETQRPLAQQSEILIMQAIAGG